MKNPLGVLFLLGGALAAQPVFAGDSATMKCDASHDRVWVYDSLTTFDVAAKLKCGETVEITSRVKGYVKIRAANGAEGYVPDSTFPDLPPFVDPNDSSVDTASLAKRIPARAAARPVAVASVSPAVAPVAAPAAPPSATAPKPAPSIAVAAPSAAPGASASPATAVTVAQVRPTPAPSAAAPAPAIASVAIVARVQPAPPPAAKAPPVHPAPAPAPTAIPPASSVRTVSESSSAATETTSMTIEPAPATPAPAPATGARSFSTPAPGKKSNSSASGSSASKSTALAAGGKSGSSKSSTNKAAATQPQPSGSAHPAPTPSVPTPAAPITTRATESTASVPPPREVASVHTVSAIESDEDPGYLPENASADPACQRFFSAYGLSPAQAKWIAQNRKKQFSSVCPAPDPSKVDFVIIFTHDVDFFGGTLPTEIHRDHNGFSDFSPMTMIDSALIPQSEANKSHREYVWVFKMQRGAFDPSKFSPRRHPQFSKTEARAPSRTVEEAFQFIESGGVSQ